MKIGMNLLLWTGSVNETHVPLLKKIKKWGFDGVEFPMFDVKGSPWGALGAACDALGLERTTVACLPQGANLIGSGATERQAAQDFLKGCVDASVVLGSKMLAGPIYSPVGRLVGRGPDQSEFEWAAAGLKFVGRYAAAAGVSISVEPLNRFETYFLNSQEQACKLTDAIGLKNVGHMYDTFHANIEEKDIAAAIKRSGKRINHVHISANDRATPGEDHVDYKKTIAALKSAKYNGWLTIEAFGRSLPELAAATCIWRGMFKNEEHVAKNGCKFVRKLWGRGK
ncbi:sugar phosphate isomerase/epimerase [Candidatus Sumerlaeota bacterium]|nr:sugar phosphate isomerase/epimerase [Candidatus Sumerlaeota bacterium]